VLDSKPVKRPEWQWWLFCIFYYSLWLLLIAAAVRLVLVVVEYWT
jgi:hypothetical protein